MKQKVSALVLAAGASSRMGRPKALLPWGPVTVLEHLIGEIADAGITEIVVVAGKHVTEIGELIQGRATVCEHAQWAQGIGGSIRMGTALLRRQNPPPEAILILLADQPLVSSGYLRIMLTSFENGSDSPVASAYPEGPGVPALVPAPYFDRLEGLPDHKGARSLLKEANARVLDPGVAGQDMDTPEMYRDLLKQAGLD